MTTAAVNTAPPLEANDGVVNNKNSSKNLTKYENAQSKEKDGRKKSNRNNTRGGSNMTSKKKQSANHERKLQHLQNGGKEGVSSSPSVPKNDKVHGSNEKSRINNQNNQDGRKKKQASSQKNNPKTTPKKDQIIPSTRNDNDDSNHHKHLKHSNRKSSGGDAHTQKNVRKENPQSQQPQQQQHRGGGRGGRRSRKQPSHSNNDNFHDQDTYYSQYDGNVGVTSPNTSNNRRRNGNGNSSYKKNNHDRKSRSNREINNHEEHDNNNNRGKKDYHNKSQKHIYPPHISLSEALKLYADTLEHESNTNNRDQGGGAAIVIRGKIRVMRGNSKDAMAFISCDRGSLKRDAVIQKEVDRNRALDGDIVYVQLNGPDNDNIPKQEQQKWSDVKIPKQRWTDGSNNVKDEDGEVDLSLDHLNIDEQEEEFIMDNYEESSDEDGSVMNSSDDDYEIDDDDDDDQEEASVSSQTRNETSWTWQDDDVQCQLWDPAIAIPKPQKNLLSSSSSSVDQSQNNNTNKEETMQYTGRVIHIAKPPTKQQQIRTIVGRIKQIHNGNRIMFVPTNTSLPQFVTPAGSVTIDNSNKEEEEASLWKCEYHSGSVRSWPPQSRLPHCINLSRLGHSFNPADETLALLIDNGVNHGDFPPQALANVDDAVKSGRTKKALNVGTESDNVDLGWQPTEKMLEGRRDFRKERIFTIDPTTAKDLDDALHIKPLPNNKVEIGVHIADVSHFVKPHTAVDEEATRRATTVYLVDQTIPMLPRPLCEIACSLNENVDRLSFSCVWIMNMDGTLATSKNEKGKKEESVWYGKSVIRSCARLDYATAQNIIEEKVVPVSSSSNDDSSSLTEELWPTSRRPTGGHTPSSIASDVRLMHKVAMARRALRFTNGALALHGVKLIFTFEDFENRDSPSLAAPYPIKDSNRLVEEYMLIANYLVAQRLLTHAGGLALIRNHPPPKEKGLGDVVDVAKKLGFEIDSTDSRTLNDSLKRIGRECDDMIILQGITEMMMVPMQPAEYIAAGEVAREEWRHFALNIPYYTHFTSPIRRYADVMVHRLLQATLDDEKAAKANMNKSKTEQTQNNGAIANFHMTQQQIHATATHCNEKRMGAKHAQERSDRVFLSLYLKKNPIDGVLGIVTSLGEKTFTAFVPSLGLSQKVFLDEHKEDFDSKAFVDNRQTEKRIRVTPKNKDVPRGWSELVITIFTKISVSYRCKDRPPIDVQIKILGPWMED